MTYLYIFIFLAILTWVEYKNIFPHLSKVSHYIVIALFIFIAGLRYETGVDWAGYQYTYDSVISFDKAVLNNSFDKVFVSLDVGYTLFNSIVKMFGGGLQVIFFIVSVLSTLLLYKNIQFFTKQVVLGLLIYYCFFFFVFDMSGLRQGLAMQLVLLGITYLLRNNNKKFFLYVILAGTIHWSSFLMLLTYFIKKKSTMKYHIAIFPICILVFLFQIPVIDKILPNANSFIGYSLLLADKVSAYTTHSVFAQARTLDDMSIFTLIKAIVIYILSLRYMHINKYMPFFFNMFIIEVICYFGLYELSEVSERLRYYFTFSELFILVFIFSHLKLYYKRDFLYITIFVFTFVNAVPYFLHFPGTIAYFPYQNYWIYKAFDKRSTGEIRLQKHIDFHLGSE